MTVPVRISGAGPFRFLVDTGSDRTAIARQLASGLELRGGSRVQVHGVAGSVRVATAMIDELEIARMSLRHIEAPLLDARNMGADGILGTDTLESRRVEFDFGAGTMSIVPSAAGEIGNEPGSIVIDARRRNGRLVIADATTDRRHVLVVLDTGAEVTVGNSALREALERRGLLGEPRVADLRSVTGDAIRGEWVFLREIEIGGIRLTNVAVVFADAHTFRELKLHDRPALLLGMNALRAFRKVSIDFGTGKLRVAM